MEKLENFLKYLHQYKLKNEEYGITEKIADLGLR